jgi:hypothetical protein
MIMSAQDARGPEEHDSPYFDDRPDCHLTDITMR